MNHLKVKRGVPAALFHFQQTTDGYCLTRSQRLAGQVVLSALQILLEQGLQTDAIYTDYLMNLRGFPSDHTIQVPLPLEVGSLSDLIATKGRSGQARVEALTIDGAGGTADCVSNKLDHEPGLVVSPHVAIALAKSLQVMILMYRGEQLPDGNYTALRLALRRDIEGVQPDFFVDKRRGPGEARILPESLVSLTLNRILGARPVVSSEKDLHIAVWAKPAT